MEAKIGQIAGKNLMITTTVIAAGFGFLASGLFGAAIAAAVIQVVHQAVKG